MGCMSGCGAALWINCCRALINICRDRGSVFSQSAAPPEQQRTDVNDAFADYQHAPIERGVPEAVEAVMTAPAENHE